MNTDQFLVKSALKYIDKAIFKWQTPSNIALVKYWGKSNPQIPKNASISFTLNNCHTNTSIDFERKQNTNSDKNENLKQVQIDKVVDFDLFFEGKQKEEFKPKIAEFFKRVQEYCPYIYEYKMTIHSDLFGVKFPYQVHSIFKNYQDVILLVDKGEKQVSSTIGHNLMINHPFAENRFLQANENLAKMSTILQEGNLKEFINLVESEALTLHAMMLTSNPYFILMKPNTLEIINKIWEYRQENESNICFTLDAGANVHVLFPENEKENVLQFIDNQLSNFCDKNQYIIDSVGLGAKNI